jgi:hypothetical protein
MDFGFGFGFDFGFDFGFGFGLGFGWVGVGVFGSLASYLDSFSAGWVGLIWLINGVYGPYPWNSGGLSPLLLFAFFFSSSSANPTSRPVGIRIEKHATLKGTKGCLVHGFGRLQREFRAKTSKVGPPEP